MLRLSFALIKVTTLDVSGPFLMDQNGLGFLTIPSLATNLDLAENRG